MLCITGLQRLVAQSFSLAMDKISGIKMLHNVQQAPLRFAWWYRRFPRPGQVSCDEPPLPLRASWNNERKGFTQSVVCFRVMRIHTDSTAY